VPGLKREEVAMLAGVSTEYYARRIERILAGMTGTPAYIRNARMDILAANNLCFALYTGILSPGSLPLNLARFMFLDPRAQDFFVEWDSLADDLAAALRSEAGRRPHDRALNSLIGDLATGSAEFSVDLTLIAYTAEPGSPAQEQLDFLTSWSIARPAPESASSKNAAHRHEQPS
jgi:hypothetical protein